jgi:predicted AAA+ superfamily ATPase
MDILFSYHDNIIRQAGNSFYRFLYERINWDEPLLAIKGPRGAGKTTMMLQRIRYGLKMPPNESLYVTADHHWFYTHTLAKTVEDFVKGGGNNIFIDEVHKYPHWSREIKNLHDAFPELKIVLSGSSALELQKGEADLSRRLITWELPGMSFREFLSFQGIGTFPTLSFQGLPDMHYNAANEIMEKLKPLPLFNEYLRFGYFPFYKASTEKSYLIKLLQVINTTVETDLSIIENFNAGTAQKVKKLLGVLSESAPFKPNIAALARKLDASRDSVYEWIAILQKAKMINALTKQGKGTSTLQKPEKIFLENTNQAFALKPIPDRGNIRETFLYSQLLNSRIETTYPEEGDFIANGILIEVGGQNKALSSHSSRHIIAADNIETGYKHKIPLWLFGFLY